MPNGEEAMRFTQIHDLLECIRAPLSAHCTGAYLFQGVARRVMSWMQPFFKGCKAPADPFHHGVPGACFSTAFGIATNHEMGAE